VSANPVPPLYLANLLALVTTGVLACGWLLYYTDSFEVVGGLLGLGGLFAWVAFVLGLLTDSRKEALQTLFEAQVLLRWRTLLMCGAALVGLAVLTAMSGTVVLDAEADAADHMVSVQRVGVAGSPSESRLPARSARRLWFLIPPGATKVRIKVTGLPQLETEVHPPFRTNLSVPSTFLTRPLLLVRPGPLLSGSFARTPEDYDLHVSLANRTTVLRKYGGQTVWIGADDDVPIPAAFLQRWRETLMIATALEPAGEGDSMTRRQAAVDLALARWATPRSVFADAVLAPGQEATIEIRYVTDKHVVAQMKAVVRPASTGDAVQEVVLE
jgi:hypothetical protein